jgi:hypothetical protein
MALGLDPIRLAGLLRDPHEPVHGRLAGVAYAARVAIPDYGSRLARYYGRDPAALGLAFEFRHFGLTIAFEAPVELAVHDGERRLDEGLRALLARFGPVTLRNAYLPERARANGQRNVFQSLSFHVDRGLTQDDHTSLFWRDPFDPVQQQPRSSSTLVLANAAAYLQALKEGRGAHEFKLLYQLFETEEVGPLIGEVMVELAWRAPEGMGEIALIDNRKVLHASYYTRPEHKGYPIAVRYLF